MPLLSISAVFDGKEIHPLEPVPVESPYHVLVTFLEPASEELSQESSRRFWESFGAWRDSGTTEDLLREIHTGISKTEAPSL